MDAVVLTLVHPTDFGYLSLLYESLKRQSKEFLWIIFVDGNEAPPFNIEIPHKVFYVGNIDFGCKRRVPCYIAFGLKYILNNIDAKWIFILDSDVYLARNYIESCMASSYDLTHGLFYELYGGVPYLVLDRSGRVGFSGAALMIRTDVIRKLNIYPVLGWDTILYTLALLKGYKVGVNDGTFFVHLKPQKSWKRHFVFGEAHAKMGFNFLYLLGKAINKKQYSLPFIIGAIYGYLTRDSIPKSVYIYYRNYSRYLLKVYLKA